MKIVFVNKDAIESRQRAKELVRKWREQDKAKAQKEFFKSSNKQKHG